MKMELEIKLRILTEMVCKYFHISENQLTEKFDRGEIRKAQLVFCAIVREEIEELTLDQISHLVGAKDHSGVWSKIKVHSDTKKYDQEYSEKFEIIKSDFASMVSCNVNLLLYQRHELLRRQRRIQHLLIRIENKIKYIQNGFKDDWGES